MEYVGLEEYDGQEAMGTHILCLGNSHWGISGVDPPPFDVL